MFTLILHDLQDQLIDANLGQNYCGCPLKDERTNYSVGASTCQITMTDEGPSIPGYAKPHIGEQFYSLAQPDGTKGSGLGLRIATQIVKLHGGSISLKNRSPNGASRGQYGCIATITL
jgi:signal transduction histidine kinase